MLRPAAALATLALLATAGDAAPHGGRVVRVERHSARPLGTPRHCEFDAGTVTSGHCFGHSVEIGETVTIVSLTDVVAHLEITRVVPDGGGCSGNGSWNVEGELDKPVPAALQKEPLFGVIDGGMDPRRSHAVQLDNSPSGRQSDAGYTGFDSDGDGSADLMFDNFMCDASGLPSQAMTAQCFETWTSAGRDHELRRLRLDVVPQC